MEYLHYALIAYAVIGLVVGFLYGQMYADLINGREPIEPISPEEILLVEKLRHGGIVLKITTWFAVFSLAALFWPIWVRLRMISNKF